MENIIFIILGVAVGGVIVYLFLNKQKSSTGDQSFSLLQQQMSELARALDSKLTESRRDMQDAVRAQFSDSQKLIKLINNDNH